ncbi:MAG TPA: hypothetical protein VEA59_04065 [Patescibacteria group bacterium]|nr:hypothetical protein [Patescibacteria group bacterium]
MNTDLIQQVMYYVLNHGVPHIIAAAAAIELALIWVLAVAGVTTPVTTQLVLSERILFSIPSLARILGIAKYEAYALLSHVTPTHWFMFLGWCILLLWR